jgi:hypothetical protein
MEKTHQAKEKFDPDSTFVQDAYITDKLGFLTQMKTLHLEAQYSIEERHIFTLQLQQLAPNIYQTAFKGLPQQLAHRHQSGVASPYTQRFQFFSPPDYVKVELLDHKSQFSDPKNCSRKSRGVSFKQGHNNTRSTRTLAPMARDDSRRNS